MTEEGVASENQNELFAADTRLYWQPCDVKMEESPLKLKIN